MTKAIDYESSKCFKGSLNELKKPRILRRHWVVILSCFAAMNMFMLRYNLSVAIIAILEEELPVTDELRLINSNDTDVSFTPLKKYPFSDMVVGQILASYFYGYTIFQLPAGRLSELFGARWMMGLGLLFSGILSFLTPFLLEIHYIALCITRFLIGSFQCAVLSCAYTLFSEWLPHSQKSTAITLVNVAFEIGGMLAFFLTGIISTNIGWQWSFYIFSFTTFVWFVPFYFFCYSNPDSDPHLSEYERRLVDEERKKEYEKQDFTKANLVKIPPKLSWKILLTSPPVIASACAKSAIGFAYYVITIKMPGYLHDVFNLSLEESGSYTSIAEGCCFAGKLLCLPLAGYVFHFKYLSLTTKRKIFQAIAMLLPAISFLIVTFKNDSRDFDIILLCIACFGLGFVCLGDTPITAEFAKDLSGSLFGLTNTGACFQGVLTPVISSAILAVYPDDLPTAWNLVFYITAAFCIISCSIFSLFATAEVQPWAVSQFVSADEEKEKKNKATQSSA